MTRVLFFIVCVVCFTSCFKKKVVHKIEGDWTCYRMIDINGVPHDLNDNYRFESSDKESDYTAGYTFYGSDTSSGTYTVLQKGIKVYMNGKFSTGSYDTLHMEDIDKESMVMTLNDVVFYFRR